MKGDSKGRAKNRIEAAFTLVELLVVIVILSILAAVVVFAVSGITTSGKSGRCAIEVRTVNAAIQAYYEQNRKFPAALATMVPQYLPSATTVAGTAPRYVASTGIFTETCPAR